MASIIALQDQYDNREMLARLTGLGPTVEAEVKMREQEQKIAQVYKLLEKEDTANPDTRRSQARDQHQRGYADCSCQCLSGKVIHAFNIKSASYL